MDFHGVDMQGDILVERLSVLQTWTAADKGRIVYAEDKDRLYLGNDIGWRDITSAVESGDGLTKIQVEETDGITTHIRFDIAGTEQVTIQDGVIEPTTDNDIDLGSVGKGFKKAYVNGLEVNSVYTMPIVDGSASQYLQTNGSGTVSWATNIAFPAGTVMLFGQSTAPTSWTKKIDWTDQSMIVYTTGNIAQGGSVDAKATHTHTGGGHVLTTAEMPAHNHSTQHSLGLGTELGGNTIRDGDRNQWTGYVNSTGGGGSHSHGATSANSAPRYCSVIAATKD